MQHLQHVGGAQRIPGIKHIVVAEADVDLCLQHLFHPRNAAPLRIGVEAALQVNIDQRISDKVNARQLQQPEQS